jgi:para-nitrobenzyl esterase
VKKRIIITTLIIVLIVIAIAVGLWLTIFRHNPEIDLTSGTDYILEWKERTTIDTRLGKVTGLSNGRAHAFLGLRYAQPPTGDRRFLAPVGVLPWEGTYDATAFPIVAMQSGAGLEKVTSPQMSEDCLFLNIFTPSPGGANRPVLLWIHGGSFIEGSANGYDGSVLAEQGDVVVVAINYRLGMFGFLDLSGFGDEFAGSASNGIQDQILALEWVRDNIADYGGDRNNVTIFGESAGGTSVLSIISAPSADGLYHRAVAHSGVLVHHRPWDHRQALAKHLKVELADLPAILRGLSAEDLLAVQKAVSFSGGGNLDGTVVTSSSNDAILDRAANGVPLIAGSNRDEGTLFSYLIPWPLYGVLGKEIVPAVIGSVDAKQYLADLKEAYARDSRKERFERIWVEMFRRGATNSAVRASASGPGGWLYRFDMPVQRGFGKDMGATHAAEIAFTFNTFASDAPDSAFFYDRSDPAVRQLALNWSNTILQFAKTGDPNGAGLPSWPRYTAESRQTLILDSAPRVEAFLNAADRERWGDTETATSDFILQGAR